MQTDQMINTQSGSMQEGIATPYDFEIMEVIKEAWQRTSGLKGSVLGAGAIIFIILTVLSFAVLLFLDLFPLYDEGVIAIIASVFNLIISLLSYPFFAGILMMGLYRAVDAQVSYKMAFAYVSYALPVILASICMSIFIALGFMLLIIPGIYLSVAYMFTLPLIIDKNMDFWQAMEVSRKAATQHWFKLFFTSVIMLIIYFVSVIPLGIGLIWTIPMFIALQGVLYRRVFGIESV